MTRYGEDWPGESLGAGRGRHVLECKASLAVVLELIILPLPLRLCCAWQYDAGLGASAAGVGIAVVVGRSSTMLLLAPVANSHSHSSLELGRYFASIQLFIDCLVLHDTARSATAPQSGMRCDYKPPLKQTEKLLAKPRTASFIHVVRLARTSRPCIEAR